MNLPSLSAIHAPDFDLAATLHCGQVFHWKALGPGYVGAIGATPLYVEQRGDTLWFVGGTEQQVGGYFALDHPLPEIYASFPRDATMASALAVCRGLRIIRQPLWECLATFITSALKQVSHIAQISHTLRRRFGTPAGTIADEPLFAYPSAEQIAARTEADLRACGLGFRARGLLETARAVADASRNGTDLLGTLCSEDRAAALQTLTRFRGVGTKVANCVLLFAYQHLDAFPIDVWIERVLRDTYFPQEPEASLAELQRFAQGYFGPYGGYAQQYLFHQARLNGRARPLTVPETSALPVRRMPRRSA